MAKGFNPVYYYPTDKTGVFQGQLVDGKVLKDIKDAEHSVYGGWWPSFFPTAVGLLVTGTRERHNVMTVGCMAVVNAYPFMIGFPMHAGEVSPRGDGRRYSLDLLEENQEFTVNIGYISDDMTSKVHICGSLSGRDGIDKFMRAGLTAVPSRHVAPPIIKECSLNMEGRVHTMVPLYSHKWVIGQIEAVYLDQPLAEGRQQLVWRSMPELVERGN